MNQIIATAISLLFLYAIIPTVTSQCYSKMDCFNDEKNATEKAGDWWKTPDCYNCTCSSYTITVKTCLVPYEVEEDDSEVKKSGSDSEKPVEVEVNSDDIQCPNILIDHVGEDGPVFPPVKYVNYVKTVFYSGCCNLRFSYSFGDDCEEVVDPNDSCKVRVVDKETGGPCTTPLSAVGK